VDQHLIDRLRVYVWNVVGSSRMTHEQADIVGGALLGILIACVCYLLQIVGIGQRIDQVFGENQAVLHAFETDTARALSTTDSRSQAFVDELRSQIFQSKSQDQTEKERMEHRINQKLDEIKRSLDNYVETLVFFSISNDDQCRCKRCTSYNLGTI
jgi:hypothetical protein